MSTAIVAGAARGIGAAVEEAGSAAVAQVAERRGVDLDAMAAVRVTAIPVDRAGTAEHIAHPVFFSADERSGFVSGRVLSVAGGPFG